jgi:pyruvate/2-oxoacid:ferredoxin oxidoreductase beta subunit
MIMPIYTVKYECPICGYSVGDLTVHSRSKRHKKIEDLYKLLAESKSKTRKDKIVELIEYEKCRREQGSLKYETRYKQYFKELYEAKQRKENRKIREEHKPIAILKNRTQITRPDGLIETVENWKLLCKSR